MQLREQMKADLLRAMKERQSATVSTLRSVLAAIDNAEAVPVKDERTVPVEPVLDQRHEVPRKILSADNIHQIVQQELDERRAASLVYAKLGKTEEADRLQHEVNLLSAYLSR
ncbi:MAG: GatB/YqeY domain-containing protein [Chloroflexi bacterium]|nr:GatB/YqeY domain-containing protein [Chloroflexota bacterium]